jgi:hypothetical protein
VNADPRVFTPMLLVATSLVSFAVHAIAESPKPVADPDCASFEARGPMREVRITGDRRDDVPVYDVTRLFPVADTARYGSPPFASRPRRRAADAAVQAEAGRQSGGRTA